MTFLKRLTVLTAAACLLIAGSARAAIDQTNYWTDPGSGYSGNFTNTAQWTPNAVPDTTDLVWFSNQQVSAYTVTLTSSQNTGPLRIYDDNVTFNLNGYRWDVPNTGENGVIGTNNSFASVITFSSSSGPNVLNGNVADLNAGNPYQYFAMGGNTKIVVDDSLGYPVTLRYSFGGGGRLNYPASLLVEGPGSEFDIGFPNSSGGLYAPVLITNGATLAWNHPGANQACFVGAYTTTVHGSTMRTTNIVQPVFVGGSATRAGVVLLAGSIWYDSNLPFTYPAGSGYPTTIGYTSSGGGDLVLDNSTYVGQVIRVGNGTTDGTMQMLNGSSATFSNHLLVSSFTTKTNTLVLNNGTISLGGGSVPGVLTNRGVMRAAGTIKGNGSGPALVRSERSLEIGSSIGTLNLVNANLELAAGSQTLFEFSDTGLDQILISGGSASLLGSNVFSLASGSAPLGPYKWGLGAYDFVVGDAVTWNPQYDNLTNLLSNAGLVQGLHYSLGVVDMGSYEALRLEFVPEPSTVLLLVGGGLLLWRVRKRS